MKRLRGARDTAFCGKKAEACSTKTLTSRIYTWGDLPGRDCSRKKCRNGCDLAKKIEDEACDLIKNPVTKTACKALAATVREFCYETCNAWCRKK